jgi:hypothetical protein
MADNTPDVLMSLTMFISRVVPVTIVKPEGGAGWQATKKAIRISDAGIVSQVDFIDDFF